MKQNNTSKKQLKIGRELSKPIAKTLIKKIQSEISQYGVKKIYCQYAGIHVNTLRRILKDGKTTQSTIDALELGLAKLRNY